MANKENASEVPRDLVEHGQQRDAILGAKNLVEPCLVLGDDEFSGARQDGAAGCGV